MNANARHARAALRNEIRAAKVARKARKIVRTAAAKVAANPVQPVTVHLVAAGIEYALAARFSGAFSRGVAAAGAVRTRIVNPKGKRNGSRVFYSTTKTVHADAVRDRLAGSAERKIAAYRPKDKAAAAAFAAAA